MGIYDIYELIVIWNRSFIPEMLELMEKGEWYGSASKRVKELLKTYYETGEFHVERDEHIEFRYLGIVMACYDEDNFKLKYPIKITSKPMAYEDAEPSYSDPDQGWESHDDDEEEYW